MVDISNEIKYQQLHQLSPIERLPQALHQYSVFYYLSDDAIHQLSQTSVTMYQHCQESLMKRRQKKLLSYVLSAQETDALKMIEATPTLLLQPSEATDFSGRYYHHITPFQAALLCQDVLMWQKMLPYFEHIPNGPIEKRKQFNILFPQGINAQKPYDFNPLIQTIQESSPEDIQAALNKFENDSQLSDALTQFRATFKAQALQELFFNPSHLIHAITCYHQQFPQWSSSQRALFWRQVIGYTQRFIPACFAQLFAQGISSLSNKKLPTKRSLKYKFESSDFFPLHDAHGLGFDLGADLFIGQPSVSQFISFPNIPATAPGGAAWLINKHCQDNMAQLIALQEELTTQVLPLIEEESLPSEAWCTIS